MTIRTVFSAALLSATVLANVASSQAPAAVSAPPPLPKGVPAFEVAQLNAFTWYGRFGYTNCGFIDMGDGVLVIDTGWTKQDAENLKAQIKEKTKGKPVRWIVMTQTDIDSNGGIEAFLPTDATIFVHSRAVDPLSRSVLRVMPGEKRPTVVGVVDRLVVNAGGGRLEMVASPGGAHSAYDLVAVSSNSGIAFVGDLVTSGRCPNLAGGASDPAGWKSMLDRIEELGPVGLIATRGDPIQAVREELQRTGAYLERVRSFLSEQKAKASPEARVAAELSLKDLGTYCPGTVDNANVLALFRRLRPDGTFAPPAELAPAPTKPTPAAGKAPR
jgi:glyoxylase-like metal-dependent hydrolase (beta-lactamase superfamily II)